jgi:hypothetical protein
LFPCLLVKKLKRLLQLKHGIKISRITEWINRLKLNIGPQNSQLFVPQ